LFGFLLAEFVNSFLYFEFSGWDRLINIATKYYFIIFTINCLFEEFFGTPSLLFDESFPDFGTIISIVPKLILKKCLNALMKVYMSV